MPSVNSRLVEVVPATDTYFIATAFERAKGKLPATGKRQFSLLAFDISRGTQIAELWDSPRCSLGPIAFSPLAGDFRLLATTRRTGFARPFLSSISDDPRSARGPAYGGNRVLFAG